MGAVPKVQRQLWTQKKHFEVQSEVVPYNIDLMEKYCLDVNSFTSASLDIDFNLHFFTELSFQTAEKEKPLPFSFVLTQLSVWTRHGTTLPKPAYFHLAQHRLQLHL